ncbi:MAG TPA: DUF58 domain-containing protein, partial [Opitutaceae bacterium]
WHGPGAPRGRGRRWRLSWRTLLWALVFPRRGERTLPTLSGVILISLSLGIGTAAYNAANNILFITLSLLLACLILSGFLSWFNFLGIAWRLQVTPPWRAGQSATVTLELRNRKRLLPTYGLWFELHSTSEPKGTTLALRERLDPLEGSAQLEWVLRPARRGVERIELVHVGSLFPFGFLRKKIGSNLACDVIVWPAPVAYQKFGVAGLSRPHGGESVARLGQGGDLLALRKYTAGDSHRLIHWKASARLGQLMVRQYSAESQEGYSLWLEAVADVWIRPEQFELLCSFAVTLAEDLFKAGRLGTVAINAEAPHPVRRLRDLEAFFDRVAALQPVLIAQLSSLNSHLGGGAAASAPRPRRNLLTFAPDGARGVAAYVDGQKAATA